MLTTSSLSAVPEFVNITCSCGGNNENFASITTFPFQRWGPTSAHVLNQTIIIWFRPCTHCLLIMFAEPEMSPFSWFLAGTKQLWTVMFICLPVCHTFFHYVSLVVSPWNFRDLLPLTKVMSIHKVKVRGQRSKSQRSKIFFFAIWQQFQFEFADGYEMKRIAVMSMKDVPFCFSRASVKFQSWSHGLKIDLNLIWARWQGRSQLSDPSDLPFLSLAVLKVVSLTNFIAASDKHFVKMTTSSFQCWFSGRLASTGGTGCLHNWLAMRGNGNTWACRPGAGFIHTQKKKKCV